MRTKTIVYIAVAVFAVVGVVLVGINHSTATFNRAGTAYNNRTTANRSTEGSSNATASNGTSSSDSSNIIFADTMYAPYLYLISSNPVSQQARGALDGYNFSMTSLDNGSRSVSLYVNGTKRGVTFSLDNGYSLYVIETSYSDDGFGHDSSLADDAFAIVDSRGYLVKLFQI